LWSYGFLERIVLWADTDVSEENFIPFVSLFLKLYTPTLNLGAVYVSETSVLPTELRGVNPDDHSVNDCRKRGVISAQHKPE
jgi:hypothetical protein